MSTLKPNLTPMPQQLKNHSGWFVIIGVVLIILGLLALSYQLIATVFSIYFIGILLFIAGLAQSFHSFKTKGFAQTALWAVMGVLYIIAGVISLAEPIAASTAFTLILCFLLVVSGITQIMSAIHNRKLPKWGWWLFSGIITLVLGIVIIAGWPVDSLWILGMFLGIDLIFQGWAYIAVGFAIKSVNK